MRTRQSYTIKELNYILQSYLNNIDYRKVAKKLNASNNGIYTFYYRIKMLLSSDQKDWRKLCIKYRFGRNLLKVMKKHIESQKQAKTPSVKEEDIDRLFQQLKQALVDYSLEKTREIQQREIDKLKKKYEKKINDLQTVVDEAKKLNLADMLKKRLMGMK